MTNAHESRPQADPGAAKSFGGDYGQATTLPPCPRCLHEWTYGMAEGIARGRAQLEAEIERRETTLGQNAARIVHSLAGIDPRDAEADNAAAAERELWWAKKRGEVA